MERPLYYQQNPEPLIPITHKVKFPNFTLIIQPTLWRIDCEAGEVSHVWIGQTQTAEIGPLCEYSSSFSGISCIGNEVETRHEKGNSQRDYAASLYTRDVFVQRWVGQIRRQFE